MNVHFTALKRIPRSETEPSTVSSFAIDVLDGLARPQKQLSPKYFYDATGSDLFEQITALPEYYPTRTELGILRQRSPEIAGLLPNRAALVEFGAGATTKIRLLLETCDIAAYLPVDISADFLQAQARVLRRDFPKLMVHPIIADFTQRFVLPPEIGDMPKVGFFPGSTLGNFEPQEAAEFLQRAADILGPAGLMILGVDLEKDEQILHDAYNDAAGVTARFNLNLMIRMNRELGSNFDLSSFEHRAIYNRELHRIEMHLVSRRKQTVQVCGRTVSFQDGESIHTENSYKYDLKRLHELASRSGWKPQRSWIDAGGLFSVHVLRAM